jgi:hypothetical protein
MKRHMKRNVNGNGAGARHSAGTQGTGWGFRPFAVPPSTPCQPSPPAIAARAKVSPRNSPLVRRVQEWSGNVAAECATQWGKSMVLACVVK